MCSKTWRLLFSTSLLLLLLYPVPILPDALWADGPEKVPGPPGEGHNPIKPLQHEDGANSRNVIRGCHNHDVTRRRHNRDVTRGHNRDVTRGHSRDVTRGRHNHDRQHYNRRIHNHHRQMKRRELKNLHVLREHVYPKGEGYAEEQATRPGFERGRILGIARARADNKKNWNNGSQKSKIRPKSHFKDPRSRRSGRDTSLPNTKNQINFPNNPGDSLQTTKSEKIHQTSTKIKPTAAFTSATQEQETVQAFLKEKKAPSTHKKQSSGVRGGALNSLEVGMATILGFLVGFTSGFFLSTLALVLFALFGHYGCQILYDENNDTYRSTDKIDGFEDV
ncbi:uncharacterized protein LOC143033828 isoform X1 [Oratosquilla oratoria]|uniref:uncharacterized protein LOC143033828 isoform X1 n=1 Tax=Oratosquilla oratoria TaxID=337810 RepID=UPI003F7583F3